jgi:hypothetical protein
VRPAETCRRRQRAKSHGMASSVCRPMTGEVPIGPYSVITSRGDHSAWRRASLVSISTQTVKMDGPDLSQRSKSQCCAIWPTAASLFESLHLLLKTSAISFRTDCSVPRFILGDLYRAMASLCRGSHWHGVVDFRGIWQGRLAPSAG